MLIGEYIHTLDDKNRVSLPSKFRKEMGKQIVVAPGSDACLALYTQKEWKRISDKLGESSMLSNDIRSFSRLMFGQAQLVEVDSLGRILVPDYLCERALLKGKIAVIGVQNRAELWNEARWNEYKKQVETQADALAEKLGQDGVL